MSNGWQLEFGEWGDGSLRLAFWDSFHGEDRIYRLDPDGTIWRLSPDLTEEDRENESPEKWEQVNLHDDVRDLLLYLAKESAR